MNVFRAVKKAVSLLRQAPPAMNNDRVLECVEACLSYRELFMDTAREHGSPLYVVSEGRLRANARRFVEVFTRRFGMVRVFYAMKSNSMPEIIRILVAEGLGLEVSSGRELEQALAAGASRILFSGPGKTDQELEAAIANSDRVTVLIDSAGELHRLNRLTIKHMCPIRAGVRITTDSGGLWRKFGVPLNMLAVFLETARQTPFIKLEGLQFHTSWNLSPVAHTDFIRRLGGVLKDIPQELIANLAFLDIGGGFWPEDGEWLRCPRTAHGRLKNILDPSGPDTRSRFCLESSRIEMFADEISRAVHAHLSMFLKGTVYIEPGRWLCHDAMHILLNVLDVKDRRLVITDAGTNAVGWERFEHDYFPVINLSSPGVEEHSCLVLGSLCTPHDLWGYSFHGRAIESGDILLIPNQGAYTYSLRQEFIKPLPKAVVVRSDLNL